MINVHASLLPRWRGAAPIIHALRNGDTQTGVTIMRIRPRHFDVGEVLAQKAVSIGPDTLMPQLHAELAAVGADLLVNTMHTLEESLKGARQQDDSSVEYGMHKHRSLFIKVSAMISDHFFPRAHSSQSHRRTGQSRLAHDDRAASVQPVPSPVLVQASDNQLAR